MSAYKPKVDEKVLVEFDMTGASVAVVERAGTLVLNLHPGEKWEDFIYPHPGVPVADLVGEIKALWLASDCSCINRSECAHVEDAEHFRAAREAANKPKLKEGQEVTVTTKATITGFTADGGVAANLVFGGYPITVHPDDIHVEKP